MHMTEQLLLIGFRKKFNCTKFRSESERQAYVDAAVALGAELGWTVEPFLGKAPGGTLWKLFGWKINGKDELDEEFPG